MSDLISFSDGDSPTLGGPPTAGSQYPLETLLESAEATFDPFNTRSPAASTAAAQPQPSASPSPPMPPPTAPAPLRQQEEQQQQPLACSSSLHGPSLPRRTGSSHSHGGGVSPSASSSSASLAATQHAVPTAPAASTSKNKDPVLTPADVGLLSLCLPLRPAHLDPLDAIVRQLDPLEAHLLITSPTSKPPPPRPPPAVFSDRFSPTANDWDSLVATRMAAAGTAATAGQPQEQEVDWGFPVGAASTSASATRVDGDLFGRESQIFGEQQQQQQQQQRPLLMKRSTNSFSSLAAAGAGPGGTGAATPSQQQQQQPNGQQVSSTGRSDWQPVAGDARSVGSGTGMPGATGPSSTEGGGPEASSASTSSQMQQPRELLIFAVPLIKDKLVFLPVTAFQAQTVEAEATGITGAVKTGFTSLSSKLTNMWNGMKEKDPETLQHKIHTAGVKIMENMTAEERLMRNIPAHANKLVVYHPMSMDPSEVQEQLSTMTANYCVKSVGKAAVAGLILPVAVGLEIVAVPGTGWYALYQLYKNSVSAAGGQRLKAYLNKGADVRVNYAGDPRLDVYMERARISPDGVLTSEDIDDLCHDLQEDSLHHPLTELRNRYIRKHVQHNEDYALLPVNAADTERGGPDEQ